MQFVMLKVKAGGSQNQVLEHISGVGYGVRDVPEMAVALESCQRRVILNYMRVTSAATLTVVLIRVIIKTVNNGETYHESA